MSLSHSYKTESLPDISNVSNVLLYTLFTNGRQPGSTRGVEENGELKSRMFCIDNLSGDKFISFYTRIVVTRMSLVIQYLRFQLFREKLYRPLRMLCRCLPWMILP